LDEKNERNSFSMSNKKVMSLIKTVYMFMD